MWYGPYSCAEARDLGSRYKLLDSSRELRWYVGVNATGTGTTVVQFDSPQASYWCNVDLKPAKKVDYKTDGTPPEYYHNQIKGVDVECWDILDSTGLKNHYYIASAFAYLWRCLKKENTLKDLVKARNFLNKEIADRESNGTIQ